ncbi:MAG: hypothetical protein AAF478_02820 [Pseudomonadota bacterium]
MADIPSSAQRYTYTWILRDKNGNDIDSFGEAFAGHAPPLPYVGAACSVKKPDGTIMEGWVTRVDYNYTIGPTYLTYGSFIYVEAA